MNKILLLLLFIIPLSLFGQVESQFNGTLNVFSASRIGFTNTFTISGVFTSTTTSYTSANSAIGDIVQVQSGSRFYWLHIYSIASNSGGVITGNVRDSSSTLTTFPTGKWSIFRPTPNLRLPLSPDGETNASRSATFNTLALRVDEIQTSVASATNCERTITKSNHGFRKWTPVYWTGSNYVRPPYDSLVPDYIVVDSLTANTFKVASCGTYATVLPDGLYWFTNQSPGYSLTPDTTKAPLFQVIDSVLILNPIVGFNLMSGSGDVTSAVLADTAAAIRADFPSSDGNGVISALPLGNVTIDANGNNLSLTNLASFNITSNGKVVMGQDSSWKYAAGSVLQNNPVTATASTAKLFTEVRQKWPGNSSKWFSVSDFYEARSSIAIGGYPTFFKLAQWNGGAGYEWCNGIAFDSTNNVLHYMYGGRYSPSFISFNGTRPSSGSTYQNIPSFNFNYSNGNGIATSPVLSVNGTSGGYFRITQDGKIWIENFGSSYYFPQTAPSATSGAISNPIWTAGTPSFLRSQHGVATGTTDGSGDLTVTFAAAMPDATYTVLVTQEDNTNHYGATVHSKTTSGFKIRCYNNTHSPLGSGVSVTFSYEAKDY